ncbi:SYF2 splicing factor [Sodiomyces alkalinus F11]|uniref:Pre-mRNA-splicing factor SYF2 n=1 Tax=Sodiomyces alkalinus (strain CBS 110278 / VKM F-3762 / F11) TaxID=1314773 RepID=A0A3N2PV20_SODAK|nr:SYF2 splicing factor [Sodiomyces alkalinus F11]ROT38328.1 SYF2 splicing factor [Sodiomyces alkalinus F11]
MPPAKKRKTRAAAKAEKALDAASTIDQQKAQDADNETKKEVDTGASNTDADAPPVDAAATGGESSTSTNDDPATKAQDRLARFKALQARAKSSTEQNFKEATREAQRVATDPSQLTALNRRRAIASHKLLKADIEDAGGDFERKRAWDWTVEESEKWDRRLEKKAAHRDNTAFADYHAEANKMYKAQLKHVTPNMERYAKDKMAAIERAAASGGLDIVETEDGELIAIDKDGSFYSTADSTTFAQNKPDRADVDRLVADLRKAEEARLKKRRERMAKDGDDGDVTYINDKNKQFNQKLARFYNKYTTEIRDSFERGTMI